MKHDSGVILVNVLVTLAIGSAITVLMVTSQDSLLDRTARAAAAVQAEALAIGAETSVTVALQRDMIQAPEADHFGEPWALAAQQDVALVTGQFSIAIEDAQSRYNLNNLAGTGIVQSQIFSRLVRDLGLPNAVAATIVNHISQRGPVSDLAEVPDFPVGAAEILRPHVTALPFETGLNLNTANAVVMGAVLGNRAAARQLVQIRERAGFLTREDLAQVGVLATGGTDFTSQVFDITSAAQVDDVTVTLRSRVVRRTGLVVAETVVISRRFGP
jgi:general secretion pathway protein K